MAKALPTYPRTVYTLTYNFHIRKVILAKPHSKDSDRGGYTAKGVYYAKENIRDTAKEIAKVAETRLKRRSKHLAASQRDLEKDTVNLAASLAKLNKTKEAK